MILSSKSIDGLPGLFQQPHGASAQCAGVWGQSPLHKNHRWTQTTRYHYSIQENQKNNSGMAPPGLVMIKFFLLIYSFLRVFTIRAPSRTLAIHLEVFTDRQRPEALNCSIFCDFET